MTNLTTDRHRQTQTDRQTDTHTHKQMDKHTDRHMDRHTDKKQAVRKNPASRHTDKHTTNKQPNIQTQTKDKQSRHQFNRDFSCFLSKTNSALFHCKKQLMTNLLLDVRISRLQQLLYFRHKITTHLKRANARAKSSKEQAT